MSYMLVVLFATATVSFVLIELPPGDYLTSYIMQLRESGHEVSKRRSPRWRSSTV